MILWCLRNVVVTLAVVTLAVVTFVVTHAVVTGERCDHVLGKTCQPFIMLYIDV